MSTPSSVQSLPLTSSTNGNSHEDTRATRIVFSTLWGHTGPLVHQSGWRPNHIVGVFRREVGLSTIARLGRGVATLPGRRDVS
jgi:hypothetical protein